jgi:glutamate-1-semialdehyde 2,1-aminomutase
MSTRTQAVRRGRRSDSERFLQWARRHLAGGDSSTMRVLPYHLPLVAARGEGALVWDLEGNQYLDLNMAYGPLIFGHRPQAVIDAVVRQIAERGSQLGFPTEVSARAAEKLKRFFPAMELVRFCNSGTEAMMFAARLARTVTERKIILVFEGNYHGWSDALFHRYHAPLEELGQNGSAPALPGTLGMDGAPRDLLVLRFNDLERLERCLKRHAGSVAAVVLEPIMGNAGVVPPEPGFLEGVRGLTAEHDVLLIFDEVITGMRVAAGGAQELYRVTPDITVVSKALGAGFPIAACGAPREIMDLVVQGRLFHGGVYAGNAAVTAAAEAVLDRVAEDREGIYRHLHAVGGQLAAGLHEIMARLRVPHLVEHVGPMISLFLTRGEAERFTEYRAVRRHCDFDKYIRFQHEIQRRGVYFHPNQFEPMFLSTAHSERQIAEALERIEAGAKRCLTSSRKTP